MLKVQVHHRVLGTCLHDHHCIIANPNPQSTQSTQVLTFCLIQWDLGSLIRGTAAACTGIRAHLTLTSQCVGHWDTARVLIAKLHLSLLGMSWPMIWPMIKVQAQWRTAIQSRMTFLDFDDVNFSKLRLIVHVSFQVRHASTVTISAYSTLYCALCIWVCFIRIMLSSAWILGCCAHRLSSLKILHI
jgi:hypothetical protein